MRQLTSDEVDDIVKHERWKKLTKRQLARTQMEQNLIFSDFVPFKKEIDKLCPHVTNIDNDGHKTLEVFDHFLCEGGNKVHLAKLPKGKFAVAGRWNEHVRGTLRKCFEYLKKERYYGDCD